MLPSKRTSPDEDIESRLHNLLATLKRLMPRYANGWVPWRTVAKEQEGSEEFALILKGVAELESSRRFFAQTNTVVKLTEDGLHMAASLGKERALSVTEEIAAAVVGYASTLEKVRVKITNVARVPHSRRGLVHALAVELIDEPFPTDTPVDIWPTDSSSIHGKIVGQEPDGSVVYVALDSHLLDYQLPAWLAIDTSFLLHALAERIRALDDLPPLVKPILDGNAKNALLVASREPGDIVASLSSLPVAWSRMLWGPPGAGKTFALGRLAAQLLSSDPELRLLLLAPSNRAADVAVGEVVRALEAHGMSKFLSGRRVLRFGYPRSRFVLEREELLGPPELDILNARVKEISKRITTAERSEASAEDLAVLHAEMLEVQEDVREAVREHVSTASIVATTTTQAYLKASPVPSASWSSVFVDEVTMVPPATSVYLGSLASERFLLAGDPRQLGPVFVGTRRASEVALDWMGRDIFDKAGVSSGSGLARSVAIQDSRLVRITSQRRCAPAIWDRVSRLYPEVENISDRRACVSISRLPPCPGESIVLLDTSGTDEIARCEPKHRSWQNEYTAGLAMEVASTIVAESPEPLSIAIVSPYRAQVRNIRKSIRGEGRAETDTASRVSLESGTVHQFQGSDADLVIFDLVDGPGRSSLGILLEGDQGMRLVNVAITRAKGKVILIGNRDWYMRTADEQANPLLWDLIVNANARAVLRVVPATLESAESDVPFESPIEQELATSMASLPELADVVPQYVICDRDGTPVSRADFAVPRQKYAIYCDGRGWHLKEDCWQRDLRQRNRLTELGWAFSVFSGHDVRRDPDGCAKQILETIRRRDVRHGLSTFPPEEASVAHE